MWFRIGHQDPLGTWLGISFSDRDLARAFRRRPARLMAEQKAEIDARAGAMAKAWAPFVSRLILAGCLGLMIAAVLALFLWLGSLMAAHAECLNDPEFPTCDPGQYVTKLDFTVAWAKKLKGFKTLDDLQRAAGTKGTISERNLESEHPSVSYHWRSEPPGSGRIGYMLATVYRDGGIGVEILTYEDVEIVVDNCGAFICDRCSPPISIEGAEPSWAK
jgi:hypothetical protein